MQSSEFDAKERAGVAYRAAAVSPMTARTWTRTVDLALGHRDAGGHPRYDLVDMVCLAIMKNLTQDANMGASTAATIVNYLRPNLREIIDAVIQEQAEAGRWSWGPFPCAVVIGRPLANQAKESGRRHWLFFAQDAEALGLLLDGSALKCPVVIQLVPLINGVRLALKNSASELPE